jgi:sulfatase-like protein
VSATEVSARRERPAQRARRASRGGEPWPPLWLAGVHLGGLWALAFVQPLFELLENNAAFFIARDNSPGDVLIFAFAWALGPPLVATAIVGLARLVSVTLGKVVHLALLTLLAGALALQIVKGLSPRGTVVLPLALVLGAAAAAAYWRYGGVRTLLSVLGVAPAVVLALFLVFSPVRDVVIPPAEASVAAVSGAPAGQPTPVVLMIFDELPTMSLMTRRRTVDARRYPNFARLARSSTWYQNATSVSDGTYVAVPAILTGLRPHAQLPTSHAHPRNLFTLLGRTYAQHDEEPITSVCPQTLCGSRSRPRQRTRLHQLASDLSIVEKHLIYPKDMADKLPPIDRDWEDFQSDAGNRDLAAAADARAPVRVAPTGTGSKAIDVAGHDLPAQRVRAGLDVVRSIRPGGRRPGLWMVHYVIPHVPWRFLPDGSQYVVDGPDMPGLNDQIWNHNRFELDQAFQRHFLMLQFADRLLGNAIDRMKRTGMWDKALVIVVADHGGAVGPGESRRPVTHGNFAAVAGVPFFVKLPHQRKASVKSSFVTTLDVVPTIVKQLAIRTDWKFDGVAVDEPHTARVLRQRNGRTAKLVGDTPARFARQRDAMLAAQLRRFPSGEAGIWRVGPRPGLVGRPLSALRVQGADGESGQIANARLYGAVRPASGVIPAYITGTLSGVPPGTDLAVAINGRIRATGRAYSDHGSSRFSFMVKPQQLRRGDNRIEVLSLRGQTARALARAG